MAKKGQKFKKYPPGTKELVIDEYFSFEGNQHSLSRKYGIPRETIKNWVRKVENNVDVTKDGRGCHGRPKTKNLTLEDYKERYEILKKYQAFLQARRGKK